MIKELKKVQSIHDFAKLGFTNPIYDIGGRGGNFGFSFSTVSDVLNIDPDLLPRNIGAYCSYLGGGLRGALSSSDYSSKITGKKKIALDTFLAACKRVYINIENGTGLNDETYPDGDINWEARGTALLRKAGTVSAY